MAAAHRWSPAHLSLILPFAEPPLSTFARAVLPVLMRHRDQLPVLEQLRVPVQVPHWARVLVRLVRAAV